MWSLMYLLVFICRLFYTLGYVKLSRRCQIVTKKRMPPDVHYQRNLLLKGGVKKCGRKFSNKQGNSAQYIGNF